MPLSKKEVPFKLKPMLSGGYPNRECAALRCKEKSNYGDISGWFWDVEVPLCAKHFDALPDPGPGMPFDRQLEPGCSGIFVSVPKMSTADGSNEPGPIPQPVKKKRIKHQPETVAVVQAIDTAVDQAVEVTVSVKPKMRSCKLF
jgi:hypothetical protein